MLIKKIWLKYIWPSIKVSEDKIKQWWHLTKIRHKTYAGITLVILLGAIRNYGFLSVNSLYIFLYFIYTWVMTYFLKCLFEKNDFPSGVLRTLSILIFLFTILGSFLVIPIMFDIIYFKGSFFIDNGAFISLIMMLLIFTSPSILIYGVRGLGTNILKQFNFRKYVIILLTCLTAIKIFNDFDLVYKQAYNTHMCSEEGSDIYCNYVSKPLYSFEYDTTLWIMNEAIYQSFIMIFLFDNIIPRKKF